MSVTVKHAHAYGAYLNGPEWREKRRAALERANFHCQGCSETENLEVHHLTYDRLGFERPQDLMVLCSPCHAREHGRPSRGSPIAGPTQKQLTERAHARELRDLDQAREVLCAMAYDIDQRLEVLWEFARKHGWRSILWDDIRATKDAFRGLAVRLAVTRFSGDD